MNESLSVERGTVVLIHGLARTPRSMRKLARALSKEGFQAEGLAYPSRKHPIASLVNQWVVPRLREYPRNRPCHVVGHSLGGILALLALRNWTPPGGSRMVLLAPPCHGSELVDHLGARRWFRRFWGPAALALGTTSDPIHPRFPDPVPVPVGIIAGNRRAHPLWRSVLPKPNDGAVSVQSTQWPPATDHCIVAASHPFIMNHPEVIRKVTAFLLTGTFSSPSASRLA